MSNKFFLFLQHTAPQFLLTRIMGCIADCRIPAVKRYMINGFLDRYDVDLSLSPIQNKEDYHSLNHFFTRALNPGVRPIAEGNTIVSPVDGSISQLGYLQQDSLLQAKGSYYSAEALLGEKAAAEQFKNGAFATFYLSPKDYHRVHMPLAGKLVKSTYIPGKLFSVNPVACEGIPGLFTRNERLVCYFETEQGTMAVILIGAMLVGKIETVWGLVERAKKKITRTYSGAEALEVEKGAELGRFNMGSSVIVMFKENAMKWDEDLGPNQNVVMGERLGELR